MLDNQNGYTNSSGIEPARESIERYAVSKGLKNIQDIFVTYGASEAIDTCMTSLVNAGEEVLTPAPGYPLYDAILAKLEAVDVSYYLDEDNNWMPDIEDIKSKITRKTRAIVVINPNNPTGSLATRDLLEEIVKISLENDIVIFADEIYDRMVYDGREHISIASLSDEAPIITFNGLSKNFLAPGFRIGWGVVTGNKNQLSELVEGINKFLRARLCAPGPLQYAIPAALDGPKDHIPVMMEKLTRRRDITWERLNSIPHISCVKPQGAFYAFPKLEIEETDTEFIEGLIKETGVVCVHGDGFGQKPGTRHLRFVYLPPEDILERAFSNIESYMKSRVGTSA
jgi:alanine-synthesizing transaminase